MTNAKTMLNHINNTVLKNGLAEEYNHSDDIFQEQLKIRNPNTVKEIVDKLSRLQLLNTESEIKGDAFEYFLKSLASGNDLGEYFTPRHLVKLIVALVNPKFGNTVFDPFCGTGGFLIEAFRHIKKGIDERDSVLMEQLKERSIFGIELTDTYKIAKMNMIITGDGHNNIIQGDTAEQSYWNHKELRKILDAHKIKGFDIILSNIPYGQNTDYGHLYPIPSNQGDSIFIQHIISALNLHGWCGVIIPEGFLFNPEFRKVRQYLLEQCNVTGIISLPSGVFMPYTMAKTNILIFEKGTPTKKIWFYTVENDGYELTTKRRKISGSDIPSLIEAWKTKTITDKSWTADIKEILDHNYDLLPKTYRPTQKYDSQYPEVSFAEIMAENKQTITIEDSAQYRRLNIKWYGKGVFLRDSVPGSYIKTKQQKVVKRDQFIVAEIDAKDGSFGVIPNELEGAIVSSHYFLFDLDKSRILPQYFDFVIRYGPYTEIIQKFVRGTTNYSAIRPADILRLKIPLPSLDIQQSIVERLEKQDSLLTHVGNVLNLMEAGFIDQVIFEDLANTKIVTIGDITKSTQYGITKSVMPETKGVPLIRITDIDPFGRINIDKLPRVDVPKEEYKKYIVNDGDLLLARSGSIGKCAVMQQPETDVIFASYLVRFVLDKEKLLPKYLLYFLLSSRGQSELKKRARVTAQTNINPNEVLSIEFPLPKSLQSQNEIMEKIERRLVLYDLAEKNKDEVKDTIVSIVNQLFPKGK